MGIAAMLRSRSASLMLLLVALALAAVVGSTDVDAVVPEGAPDTTFVTTTEQPDAEEFMADASFWKAVDDIQTDLQPLPEETELAETPKAAKQHKAPKEAKEVVTFDDSQTPAEKKQPIIEVKKKDMDMVSTVVKTTQKQEKQASDECEMAKKQARDKAAGATKEERHKAMKAVEKYCDKVTGDVSKEESEAVTDLTGKKDAPQTEKDAAKKERALFKKDLGSKVAVTGHKAEQMGKDQAAAKALKTMADKQHDKDQGLAIDACAKAHQMAKIAGGKKTKKGRKLLKKATKYCSTLAGVIVKEGQQIAKSVRDTAQGKVGVEDAAAGMSQGVSDEQAASLKHKAEQACDEAKSKVEEQVKAVPADKRKALRAKAMAMADALCDNVQKEVQQAIDNNAAAIDGAASASDADDDDDDEPAIDGDAIDGAASASDAPLAALKAKGDEACEHAKHMATEVAGSADEKAKAHDMAKELCKKVADAVKKEAKKEGLTDADADAESAGADMDPDKMKVIKAKADAACQHAKNMAKHLPSQATGAQKVSTMAMAQALCKKVEGLVSKAEGQSGADEDSDQDSGSDDGSTVDIAKYAMDKKAMAQAEDKNKKAAKKVMKAAKATEDDAEKSSSDKLKKEATAAVSTVDKAEKTAKPTAVKATAVGAMPAKVAGKLQTQVSKVTDAEQSDSKKARILRHMARKKVRDDNGVASVDERSKAVEIAIHFCRNAKKAVQTEVSTNDKAISTLAKHAAKKYGLEVVKMKESKVVVAPADSKASKAEKQLFKKNIGEEGAVATEEEGLKAAKTEAMKKELRKKLDDAKEKVTKQMIKDKQTVAKACKHAKDKIATMHGKHKADAREKKLNKAIKFCKKAKKVIKVEKKTDYAAIAKIEKEENAGIAKDVEESEVKHGRESAEEAAKDYAKAEAHAGEDDDDSEEASDDDSENLVPTKSHIKVSKAVLKAAKKEIQEDEAEDKKKLKKPVHIHLFGSDLEHTAVMTQKQTKSQSQAVSMCKRMRKEVSEMKKGSMKRDLARHQAVDFCEKAKSLISQQATAGKKALKEGKKKARKLKKKAHKQKKAHKLTKKQKIMQMEKAATQKAKGLDQKKDDDLEAKKAALKAKAERKIEKLAIQREENVAKYNLGKHKGLMAHLPHMKKSAVKKQLQSDSQCQSILKNLKSMHHNLMQITTLLADFEMMA